MVVDGVVELVTPIPAKAVGGGKQPSVTAPAHVGEEEKKSNLSLPGKKLIRLETPLQCQTETVQTQMVKPHSYNTTTYLTPRPPLGMSAHT